MYVVVVVIMMYLYKKILFLKSSFVSQVDKKEEFSILTILFAKINNTFILFNKIKDFLKKFFQIFLLVPYIQASLYKNITAFYSSNIYI